MNGHSGRSLTAATRQLLQPVLAQLHRVWLACGAGHVRGVGS